MKNNKRHFRLRHGVLAVIILVYFGLCMASFFHHGQPPLMGSFETFDNDDVKYLRSGWTLLETGRLTYLDPAVPTVFIMPGLPVLLAGFVLLFGKMPILAFRIFQALLLCGGLCLIYLIGKHLFGSKVALVAAGIMALYPPYVYVTQLVLTESVFCFLFLLLVLLTLRAVERPTTSRYVWGGVALGLCVLFRPAIVLYPIVVLVLWCIKRYSWGDMLRYGLIVVGVVTLMLSPWIIRNAMVFGQFIPLTRSAGNPTLQGVFVDYDQSPRQGQDEWKILQDSGVEHIEQYGHNELKNDEIERTLSNYYRKQEFEKQPWNYIRWYTVGKTVHNWKRPFLWHPYFGRSFDFTNKVHEVLLWLGLLGLVRLAWQRGLKNTGWLPLLLIAFFNISHLPFYCFPRYMAPVMFCVALLAGCLVFPPDPQIQ